MTTFTQQSFIMGSTIAPSHTIDDLDNGFSGAEIEWVCIEIGSLPSWYSGDNSSEDDNGIIVTRT